MSLVVEVMKRLAEKAKEDAKKTIEKAEEEARKIIEEAEREAKLLRERKLKELEERVSEWAESKKRTEIMRAEMEARRMLREARLVQMRAIERAFSEAERKLKEFVEKSDREYEDLLTNLTLEALRNLDGDEFVVVSNERDKKVLKNILSKIQREAKSLLGRPVKLELDNTSIETIGGVIVGTVDGRLYYNNTFEARLERIKSEKLLELMKIVSGGEA